MSWIKSRCKWSMKEWSIKHWARGWKSFMHFSRYLWYIKAFYVCLMLNATTKKKTALIFKELKRKWLMLIQCLMYVHPMRILDALLCVVLSPSLEAAVHGQLWNSMNTVWLCSYTAPLRDSSDGADHRWSVFAVKGRKGIKKYIRDLFHWRFLNMQVNFLR